MTVWVTTLKGADAGRYYVEALPRYYLESGEPPGRWLGRGAGASDLEGDVDPEAFVAVLSGFDPTGTWVRGRRYGEKSVRGFDVTCSAPKSVSVLWAVAPPAVREQVVGAHQRGRDCRRGLRRPPRAHPGQRRGPGRRGRRAGRDGGGVPPAHQPIRRSAAALPRRHRGQGAGARRTVGGIGRSWTQVRSANPVGAVPRRPPLRAVPSARRPMGGPGERHRRSRHDRTGGAVGVLEADRAGGHSAGGEAAPVRGRSGPLVLEFLEPEEIDATYKRGRLPTCRSFPTS